MFDIIDYLRNPIIFSPNVANIDDIANGLNQFNAINSSINSNNICNLNIRYVFCRL